MLCLDGLQAIILTKATRRGPVLHLDIPSTKLGESPVYVRHFKDGQGLSCIVLSNDKVEICRVSLDAWHDYCQRVAREECQAALADWQNCPHISEMDTRQRALYISSRKKELASLGGSGRKAKRHIVQEMKEALAREALAKELLSKKAPKPKQDKPTRQTTHIKSKASAASSRVLFAQKMESQGKGQAIPSKHTESLSPAVKVRKHSSN